MALHPEFPESPYAIIDPAIRWFPADEALRETSMDKLRPSATCWQAAPATAGSTGIMKG